MLQFTVKKKQKIHCYWQYYVDRVVAMLLLALLLGVCIFGASR